MSVHTATIVPGLFGALEALQTMPWGREHSMAVGSVTGMSADRYSHG